MSGKIEEILAELDTSVKYNTLVIAKFYQAIQQKQAEEVPDTFDGRTVLLNDSTEASNIASGRSVRSAIYLSNIGPCTLCYSRSHFRGSEALAQWTEFATPSSSNGSQTFPFATLAPGANIRLTTRSGIWALSLNDSSTGSYSIVEVVETLYTVKPSVAAPSGNGIDYIQNKGRMPHEPAGALS